MKISVCVATYNGEKYIYEQIESILKQLPEDAEVIISDDGSTDKTIEIIQSFEDKRVIIKQHQKVNIRYPVFHRASYFASANFENALRYATGDYVFLSDQDDVWPSNKISVFLPLLEKYDLVMSNFSLIDSYGKIISENEMPKAPFNRNLMHNVIVSRAGGCMMGFNRKVLNYILPFPQRLIAHDLWILSLSINKFKVYYEKTPLLLHRTHGDNVSNSEGKRIKNIFLAMCWRINFLFQILNKFHSKFEYIQDTKSYKENYKKNICFVPAGVLPMPPVNGGAVENLINSILQINEKKHDCNCVVTSLFNKDSFNESCNYRYSKFGYVKLSKIATFIDKCIYLIAKVVFKNKSNSYKMICQRLHYIFSVRKYLERSDFDYIIAENNHTLFMLMKSKKIQKKYKEKFIYHSHNEPTSDFGCRKQVEKCKKIFTVSNYIKECYQKRYPMACAKYYVIPNGIDVKKFSQELSTEIRIEIRKSLNISPNDFVIIYAGRISKEKGVDKLIKAFQDVEIENKKLLIVGSSFFNSKGKTSFENELSNIILPIKDKVVFTGFIQYSEIWKYYKIADVACLPSIWNDPAPLTNIECMVSGLPVITTASGGIPEYSNPDSSIIIERDEHLVENITKIIEDLYRNEEKRKKIGELNRNWGVQFSTENFYKNFINALEFE